MVPSKDIPQHFLDDLANLARQADGQPVWPTASWHLIEQLGGLLWAVPRQYGGEELSAPELLSHYEALAGACLTTCFILSQRDAACRRLQVFGDDRLCVDLFPGLVSGERVITVGLAQLTTSRQHTKPAVTARRDGAELIIDGVIPWVTGATRADWIVAGAVLENSQQVLFVLPTELPGVSIGPCLDLAALQGSVTAEVRCEAVRLPAQWLLARPTEHILQSDRGTGNLHTSCLALGLAGQAIRYILDEAVRRPELSPHAKRLSTSHENLRQQMYGLADGAAPAELTQSLRAQANMLVLHSTQAALAVSKGSGFIRQHPAQRWARQALFFLVWSCPWPVASATMDFLTAMPDHHEPA